MDDAQKKALAIYLAMVGGLGYFGHTSFAGPQKTRRINLQKEVTDTKAKKTELDNAKSDLAIMEEKNKEMKASLDQLMGKFVKPKGRQNNEQKTKIYDTFAISEQISGAAQGLVLNPKEPLEPERLYFQASRVPEEDLAAKAEGMMDPNAKVQIEDSKKKITNYLTVDQVRFKYQVSGDFLPFLSFLEKLNQQQLFLDSSTVDVYQKGASGSAIAANVIVSCLDTSDGLYDPAAATP